MRRVSHPLQARSFSVNKGLASRIPPAAGTHAIIFPQTREGEPQAGEVPPDGSRKPSAPLPTVYRGVEGTHAQLEGPCSEYEAHPTLPTHLLPGSFSWFINI